MEGLEGQVVMTAFSTKRFILQEGACPCVKLQRLVTRTCSSYVLFLIIKAKRYDAAKPIFTQKPNVDRKAIVVDRE